jgi:RNA polymerase sigma-70 factor (ECF subfamily)
MASSLAWPLPSFARPERDASLPANTRPEVSRQRSEQSMAFAETPLADLDDRTLVAACRANRVGAFDLIVERHRRAVYQLCYRFVRNHEDASDLSQEVFLRAYRALRSFRGDSTIATWLHRIGVNACLNRINAKTTLGKLTEPMAERQFVDEKAESAPEQMLKRERGARVRAAIAQLPPKQRATLILRTYQEMSHREIAEVLGSSIGAVKANFFHALGNLKKLLGDDI